MSREIKRVALDFDWPLHEVWEGFLTPDKFEEVKCPDCKNGYSAEAQNLFELWYGNSPFDPETTGSMLLRHDTPAVRAFAERNIANAPGYYGSGERWIVREGQRLADRWNGQWCHHLSQDDVDALVAGGRLKDFTYEWTRENGWKKIDPPAVVTASQVNEWSLAGFGHDAINASVVIRARCKREGVADTCPTCKDHSGLEAYEGQRAEAEQWKPTEPPAGEGWQMWETVSEGSPVTPVFATAEKLAQFLTTKAGRKVAGPSHRPMTIEQARGFVKARWAPSMVGNAGGLHDGAEFVGTSEALKGHEGEVSS